MALLQDLHADPEGGYLGLEGHVNRGSPSGFTARNQARPEWRPGAAGGVPVHLVRCEGSVQSFGTWPLRWEQAQDPSMLLAHPFAVEAMNLRSVTTTPGVATASTRTVVLTGLQPSFHVKLHYPGVLGRVRRDLPLQKALAGFELSSELSEFLGVVANDRWAMLREIGGRARVDGDSGDSWAVVLREGRPYPDTPHRSLLVPAFSLCACDGRSPDDEILLTQMFRAAKHTDPTTWLLSEILVPLTEMYFALVGRLGIMPEINAQNLLFATSSEGEIRIVLRDLGRVEKLLHIRRRQGRGVRFLSSPYKEVDADRDSGFAAIRHSFSFDFKLCGYVLRPVIEAAVKSFGLDRSALVGEVRECVKQQISELGLAEFFPPSTETYGHPKVMLTESRPYTDEGPAEFR